MRKLVFILILMNLIILSSCNLDQDNERKIDPNYNPIIAADNFVNEVTNEYFPLNPGDEYIYKAKTENEIEVIVVTVLNETKDIQGVSCTVVRDTVIVDEEIIEDTYDWYAQDKDGNVWYMGEDTSNFEDGQLINNAGSFETGVDGAKPGLIMFSNPVLQLPYRQEYYVNEAEDWGKLIDEGVTVNTEFGEFNNCLKIEEWNALEPDEPSEYKYFAPGVGLVKEEKSDGSEVVELIELNR